MTIWLRTPVTWHSSRVPSGYDFSAMTEAQARMIRTPFLDWYTCDWDYGLTTVYFFCAAIGLIALIRWGVWLARKSGNTTMVSTKGSAFNRIISLASYTTTRQFRVAVFNWNSPSLAAIFGVTGLFVFTMALMLGQRPYYWPNLAMGHSQPIATRSGWISIAIMPFMIAFASKVNWIGILTRTSHEQLQVFHRWSAAFMYITSLVHTFPFIVTSIQHGEMVKNWNTSPFYWSGVAALVPQTILIFFSWGVFRNPYYEVFKKLHYTCATVFMVALFLHCDFRLSSWDYFWATLGIWGTSFLIRAVRAFTTQGTATLEMLEDGMLRVTIAVSGRVFRWSPGQHVFVRFAIGTHTLTSHPFTIANVYSGQEGCNVDPILLLRVRDGLTQALADRARAVGNPAGKRVRVWIDGPYGHAGLASDLRRFDRVLFLSGGSGSSFVIPHFLAFIAHKTSAAKAHFVVAVREASALGWLEPALKDVDHNANAITISIHVTRDDSAVEGEDDVEKGPLEEGSHLHGRPNITKLVQDLCVEPGRVAVIACGPEEFAHDVRTAVAKEQLDVATGKSAVTELFLCAENYSW